MGGNTSSMERLVNILDMKMPVSIVGESDDIEGNKDEIRIIVKEKPESVIIFVIEDSPERTEHVVEGVLNDHKSQYEKRDSKGQMRVKYIVESVDENTFA